MDTPRGTFLTLSTLGDLEIRAGETLLPLRLRKNQALLVYLAVNPGAHSREHLSGLLWGEEPEKRARHNLRQAVWQLRRSLPEGLVAAERLSLALRADLCQVDALRLEEAVARAKSAPSSLEAQPEWETAAALYRGEFLAGFRLPDAPVFEEWTARYRAHLHEMAIFALRSLARYHEQRGEYEVSLRYLRRQLRLEPWWEEGHRAVMRLLALTGQRSAALAQYRACRRLLQEHLGLEPLEETRALYAKLVSERPPRPRQEAAARARRAPICLPFSGREEEHARLADWWEAAQAGEGGLTLLAGDAGVGKTRLMEEISRYVEARGGLVLRGRCYEFGNAVPYQPLADALRAHLEVPRARLSDIWRAELSPLLPELRPAAAPPGGGITSPDESAARQRLFEAAAHLLQAYTVQPVLLFLDDLHWADTATLDLLHYLIHRLSAAPLWFAGAFRPGEVNAAHPLRRLQRHLSREHRLRRLALAPLSEDTVYAMARALTSAEDAPALGRFLHRESEGNPFILVETLNAMQESGFLAPLEGGRWRWEGEPSRNIVPASVQDVILQRVERLRPEARRLLSLAAVIGRRFDLPLLRAAAGSLAPAVETSLEEWRERRLVLPSPEEDDRYDLSHDKIRTVIYGALDRRRRRELHLQVGQALETLFARRTEEVCEQLAYHYEQAGEVNRALPYLAAAGEKAAALYAHTEALDFYERGLSLAARNAPLRRRILLGRGRSLRFLNRYAEAIVAWQEVMRRAEGDVLSARAANALSRLYFDRREYDRSRRWALQAQTWAQESGAPLETAQARHTQAHIELRQGNLQRAAALFEALLSSYREREEMSGAAACLQRLGDIAIKRNQYPRALSRLEEALSLYRAAADRQGEAACLQLCGLAHWRQGNNQAAEEQFSAGLEIYRRIGDREGEALALKYLGMALIVQNALPATQSAWEESIAIYRSLGLERQAALGMHNLGILHHVQGRFATARRLLEESLTVSRTAGDRLGEALDRGWLGNVLYAQGAYEQARRHLELALEIDREMGGGEEETWHWAWLGATLYELGELLQARHTLETGLRRSQGEEARVQVAAIYEYLSILSLVQGEGEAALRFIRQAIRAHEATASPPKSLGRYYGLLGVIHGSGLLPAGREEPVAWFERALQQAEASIFDTGITMRRYGAYLVQGAAAEEGRAYLRQAADVFARLGAEGEFRKAQRLLHGETAVSLRV